MRRKDIPEALTNLALWPGVDLSALDAGLHTQYKLREDAIHAYFGCESLDVIEKRFGVKRGALYWFIDRCVAAHSDGRIQGFRGLIPFAHVKPYVRLKPAKARSERGGLVGAFNQLLDRYPSLTGTVQRHIAGGELHLSATNRLVGLRQLQDAFLNECRKFKLTTNDYPLNQVEKAYRSLSRMARARLEARVPIRHLLAGDAQQATIQPFSFVELDGHKLDLRLRVRYTDPNGMAIDLETERLFVLVLIDVCTRAVIGWQLVTGPEYNHFDVLLAVQNAIMPRRKRKDFSIPGMVYETGGGFVSEVCPQAAYACWQVLKFDNAKAHLAEDTLHSLCEFAGCRVDAGPIMHPALRPYIERFFRTLTDRLSRRLPGTSGNSPQDPAGIKGKLLPVEHLVLIEELEELLDVTIANYNGTAHDGLNGRTPLQAMQFFLDERKMVIRTLAQSKRTRIHQLQPPHLSTVRGSPFRGIAPYISLYGTRYSNEILERSPGLLKTKIRVYVNPDDMRQAWAYLPNGAELGQLHVLSGWRYSRHTLRLRMHILRLRRLGKLNFSDEQDPIAIYSKHQLSKIKQSRKQATRTAQVLAIERPTQEPEPASAASRPTVRHSRDDPVIAIPLAGLDMQNF